MRPLFRAALALACLAASLSAPTTTSAADPVKVAIIVGPVGSLTPTYLRLAEAAAEAATARGASVARAYSPQATPANVLDAVADANVIVYFGHGYGHPSPYGGLDTARQNGWGLQGPDARGSHDDGLDGGLAYYGEDWIVANARPAPGFVMIYSNTCYAPGASEGGFAPATPSVAAERVAYYSRKVFSMGGSAYFATDFDRGAADLVDRILANRATRYGDLFAADARYAPASLSVQPHLFSAGQQIWLHRSTYAKGPPNYWYAFAGDPDATPMRSWDPLAPTVTLERPADGMADVEPWAVPKLRFSEPVIGVDASAVRLLDETGEPVEVEVVHNRDSGAMRIVPAAGLALSTRYRIVIESGITDMAGNPLDAARWTFTTRLDADAISDPLPVVLAAGTHRLVRVALDGSIGEEQALEVTREATNVGRTRARLPGSSETWLELGSGPLTGWWVAESAAAHVPGRIEEVRLEPTEIGVPASTDAAPSDEVDGSATRPMRSVTVDGRAVIDGRTYLRLAGGDWILAPSGAPDRGAENRVLASEQRFDMAELHLEGPRTAFRFDDAGRVLERQEVGEGVVGETELTLIIAGRRFHVLGGGHLAGWAIGEATGVRIVVPEPADPT